LLLAVCGPPDEPEVQATAVWTDQLRASRRALAAYPASVPERGAASRRVRRLEALAGTVGDTPSAAPSLEAALAAEREALQTHVAAVGLLVDRASREILADLVAGTAEAVAALRARMDEPPVVDAFPGQRNRP
jgi:hypothetical protein